VRKALLACGILASLLYLCMNVFIPLQWPGYSSAAQTISELSAIGAPTRPVWFALGVVYTLLIAAFGWGIWTASRGARRLRLAGALLVCSGLFGLFWPPMHLRGAGFSLTDTLHIVWTAVSLLITLVVMGLAASEFGRGFRVFTFAILAIWLVCGTLTALAGPRLAANLPTPWIGVWERINAGAYLLWLVVFAIALIRRFATPEPRRSPPAPEEPAPSVARGRGGHEVRTTQGVLP
jgi:uncharacterized protein DUF998